MGIISNPPRGLVSLTGLRDMGDVPRELVPQVMSSIDVTELLLLNRETLDGSGVFITAQGALDIGTEFIVPPGELWYVHDFSVLIDCNAGSTTTCYAFYQETSSTGVAVGFPVNVPASTRGFARDFDFNRWAVPGAALRLYVAAFTGAPSAAGTAIITRLRI